ncbi:hypothetical protein [Microtetraspora fusca]|uniref:LPXTG cell wall anchor domain-containing protein n=1 Tax=Microtetraspora fusca TaxID=1997 RepID=A0ABW6VHR7_MICFU|nr:hypothetical protein [Microtetraspora fusca]
MRFIRTALAASALGIAVLAAPMTSAAMADTQPAAAKPSLFPSPVPTSPSEKKAAPIPRPRLVPRGAPETGGGPSDTASVLVPTGAALLAAGAGMGVLTLRRRSRAGA